MKFDDAEKFDFDKLEITTRDGYKFIGYYSRGRENGDLLGRGDINEKIFKRNNNIGTSIIYVLHISFVCRTDRCNGNGFVNDISKFIIINYNW